MLHTAYPEYILPIRQKTSPRLLTVSEIRGGPYRPYGPGAGLRTAAPISRQPPEAVQYTLAYSIIIPYPNAMQNPTQTDNQLSEIRGGPYRPYGPGAGLRTAAPISRQPPEAVQYTLAYSIIISYPNAMQNPTQTDNQLSEIRGGPYRPYGPGAGLRTATSITHEKKLESPPNLAHSLSRIQTTPSTKVAH